jgi:regulator of protease activity HflC (stomatin/prohibitin superfamily)
MQGFNPSSLFVLLIIMGWLVNSIKVLREYERGVVFRLGRLLPQAKGPGLIFVFWPIDRIVKVPLRTVTLDVPPQEIISPGTTFQ